MFEVLFVCTGNTCRSVMAEYIFNSAAKNKSLTATSAGTSAIPGAIATTNTVKVIQDVLYLDIKERRAVQVNLQLIEQSHLILCMTNNIKEILRYNFTNIEDKLYTLHQFIGQEGDIIDPYGGDIQVYNRTFSLLKKDIDLAIEKILNKEDIYENCNRL